MVAEETIDETPTKTCSVVIILHHCLGCVRLMLNVSVLIADPTFRCYGYQWKPFEMGLLTSMFVAAYGFSNFVLTPLGDRMGSSTDHTDFVTRFMGHFFHYR